MALSCLDGDPAGSQSRAGLLLAALTCRSRCWALLPNPWGGRAERARSSSNPPWPQAWLPAPASSLFCSHSASCRCCQLGLEAPPALSRAKAPAVQIFAFCHPSHHFPLLFPFKSTFCAASPACSGLPRHSLSSGTFWVSELPPWEHWGRVGGSRSWSGEFPGILPPCSFAFSFLLVY